MAEKKESSASSKKSESSGNSSSGREDLEGSGNTGVVIKPRKSKKKQKKV